MEPKQLAQALMKALKGYIARSLEPFSKRLETLETKAVSIRDLTTEEKKSIAESLLPHVREAHANWALQFERSATELMLKTIANIPEPKDGKDGLGFDDMSIEYDGRRSFSLVFVKGERRETAELRMPVVLDAGFWKEGNSFEQGDGVTHGGSYWIAQKDTTTKPEIGNPDWRLAVRKGRDAKSSARL